MTITEEEKEERQALRTGIGANIKRIREARGMEQPELAVKARVSGASIVSKWEAGKAMPGADTLERIAAALDASADDLLGLPARRSEVEEAFERILEVVDRFRASRKGRLRVAEEPPTYGENSPPTSREDKG